MIDNYAQILKELEWRSENDFYHLQILKRKKEHPDLGSNSYMVKSYYITSAENLAFHWGEIKCLCDFHNARAGINLNRRSFEKLAMKTIIKVVGQIENWDFKSIPKAYNSVCGAHMHEESKKWIIDIDTKDPQERQFSSDAMLKCDPPGPKVLFTLETKNGYHQIVKPFNVKQYEDWYGGVKGLPKGEYEKPDIQKNNPTILYIP